MEIWHVNLDQTVGEIEFNSMAYRIITMPIAHTESGTCTSGVSPLFIRIARGETPRVRRGKPIMLPHFNSFTGRRSYLLVLLGLAVSLLAATAARAAEPKKVALLVGVNKYMKAGLTNLDFPEADVEAVGTELTKLGFQVTILKGSSTGKQQATRENLEASANSLVKPLSKDDLMLVMLSGHGMQLEITDANKNKHEDGFYCPYDAITNDPTTLFSLSHLTDDILAPNVGKKLVLIDACRDVPKDPGRSARGIQGKVIALPENTAILFGCRAGQQSYENDKLGHGLFTHCLLEGLKGDAINREKNITWTGLAGFVEQRLSSDDMKALMPKDRPQEPIAAGGVGQLVLARIDVKPISIPNIIPPPVTTTGSTGGNPPPVTTVTKPDPGPDKKSDAKGTFTNSIGMKLVLIPKGEFVMGSPTSEKERSESEIQHRVKINKPFYLGKFAVTQSEYRKVTGTNESHFCSHPNRVNPPVEVATLDTTQFPEENVTWNEAIEFCKKLGKAEGKTYRLPTEAEWEYACRAGTTTPFHFGNSLNGDNANCKGDFPYGTNTKGKDLGRPTTSGSYKSPNAFGLYDMHGNVGQLCQDWSDAEYYAKSPPNDPQGPTTGTSRVVRGGDFTAIAANCRSASRSEQWPDNRNTWVGFRVVLVLTVE